MWGCVEGDGEVISHGGLKGGGETSKTMGVHPWASGEEMGCHIKGW